MAAFTQIENSIKILLVEDNPADVRMASLALRDSDLPHELTILSDGEAVLDYLKQSGPYAGSPRPDVVFLDLNLPRVTGLEILLEMRKDKVLKDIPVVVLSGSDSPETVQDAYNAGADLFIHKPVNLERFSFIFLYVAEIQKSGKFIPHLPSPGPPFRP